MIDWLGREHGLDPVQAYLLCSVAVDLRISEIVDMPNVDRHRALPARDLRLSASRVEAQRDRRRRISAGYSGK